MDGAADDVGSGAGAGAGSGSALAAGGMGAAAGAHVASKIVVNVEACLTPVSTAPQTAVRDGVIALLRSKSPTYEVGAIPFVDDDFLADNLSSLAVSDIGRGAPEDGRVAFWMADVHVFVYQLNEEGVSEEAMDGDETIPACSQWVLPAREFNGVWESLYFDSDVKNSLLEYASTAMLFADKHVDPTIISCNRVVLLHGPPGTGKTSLCKALAHKLAIRLSYRYPVGQLLEINAHSLFSKWFSESGKLVMKLFEHITELVEDSDSLVCVLIDEVESLTAARRAAVSGSEPSDAVRVVNALLTQIDALRARENVLILTTSNITDAIDVAFVDRADIKQFIGLPSHWARYEILRSCVNELIRVGIVTATEALPAFDVLHGSESDVPADAIEGFDIDAHGADPRAAALTLSKAAFTAKGLSGRALRKLPFQSHAFFVQTPMAPLLDFIVAMLRGVLKEQHARTEMTLS